MVELPVTSGLPAVTVTVTWVTFLVTLVTLLIFLVTLNNKSVDLLLVSAKGSENVSEN